MTSLFEPQRSAERRDRAALIKARLSYGDVLLALGREEEADNCVCCGVIGDVAHGPRAEGRDSKDRAPWRSDAWRCQSCGRGGDIIDFVRIVKDCGFREACDFLEGITGKQRCSKTGELFSGSSVKTSAAVPRPAGSGGSGRPVGLASRPLGARGRG